MDPMSTHGVFSWNELMTTDVEAAKKFYATLFGWSFEAMTIEGDGPETGMTYTSAKLGDDWVCGMMATPSKAEGVPPHWGSYVTVRDVDETLAQVQKLGGKILVPAFDVEGVGRMAVFQDPQGAVLSIATYLPQG